MGDVKMVRYGLGVSRPLRLLSAAVACAAAFLATGDAHAQSIYGAYEHGSDDVDIIFVGANAPLNADFSGWTPFLSVGAYRLSYPRGTTDVTVKAITPAAGLRRGFDEGSFSVSAGYKFQDTDVADPIPFFGGSEGGFSTAAALNYWGASPLRLEGLASYNWGASYLWTRARGLVGLTDDARFRAGGELSWQGQMADGDYSAVQFGPVLQASFGRVTVGVRGGWKNDNVSDDNATYFGVEAGVGLGN